MPVVGIAEIEVRPTFKGTQQAMGQMVEGSAASIGSSAGSTMGSKLGGALAATSKATAGLALAGLGVALTKGFGRLQAIEQAKASLTGLGHSAESVTEIMNNATASVKGTAFGLGDAAGVAASMVAAGIKPGKDLQKTLTLVGDAATIAGVGIGDMGQIFGKAAASNKVQMDVINQLHDAGVPALALLADQMGVTAAEASKMASDGAIDFATFEAAMTKGLGGAAQESGKTLKGAFENTMASVGRIGANLLSGVYPQFTKFFSGLITWMEPLEGKAKIAGTAIGEAMERGAAAVGGLYDVLVKGDFSTRFREAFNVEEDSRLTNFLFSVREGFQNLVGFLQGAGAILLTGNFIGHSVMGVEEDSRIVGILFAVREGFMAVAESARSLDFSSWSAFTGSLGDLGGTVGNSLGSIGQSLTTLAPAFKEFGEQLPKIGGAVATAAAAGLSTLTGILSFLADHVDTIIKYMPLIVAGFVAWRVASLALAHGTLAMQAAQLLMTPVITLNNVLRLVAIRLENQQTQALVANTLAQNTNAATGWRRIAQMGAQALATTAQTVTTAASTLAQKAWNIAQIAGAAAARGLGIAVKFALGPIGLIITAITLLVGGLVWFFTQTDLGKGIVQNAFAAIQSAVAAVVDWWNTTLIPVLQTVGQWFKDVWDGAARAVEASMVWIMEAAGKVAAFFDTYVMQPIQIIVAALGAAFTWLYETIIKPVFDSIFVVVNGFYLGFRGIFQLLVAVFKEIIAPAFMDFWHGVVEPVFAAVGGIFTTWWEAAKQVFSTAVTFVRDTLGAIFTWFRDAIIMPVFDFIVGYVTWWWNTISGTFNAVVGFIQTVLGAAFTWFRDVVIKPVFDFIVNYVNFWWNTISGIFNTAVGFLRNVLGAAFTWLKDSIITPVFNGIRDVISNVWNNGIKPVFEFLSKAIREDIPAAFQKGVDGVKGIWDTMLEIAKKPVRFVVNTVINDGLIGAFNKVAGILPGIDKLPNVALPAGFARGGVLAGKSSWRDGDDQLVPMRRGEGVYVSEAMQDPYERARLFAMNKAAMMGQSLREVRAKFGEGFARGGIVNPTKNMTLTQGFSAFHDGIDIGVGVGTPVFAADSGRITHAGPGATAPGVSGGNEVHLLANGIETWYAHLSQIGVKLGQMVQAGQQIALSGNTGISSGPHLHFGAYNGRWPNAINPLSYLSGAAVPAGGDTGSGWLDPLGAIRGLADKVVDQMRGAFPAAGFMVDAAAGMGKKMFSSVIDWAKERLGFGAVAGPQQGAHLNPILYDNGGILRPGLSQIMNATGKPEAIYTNEQNRALQSLAARGAQQENGHCRGDVIFNGNVGWNPDEVASRIETKRRDTFAAFGI